MKLKLFVYALRVIDVGACDVPPMRDRRKYVHYTVYKFTPHDAYGVIFGYPICPQSWGFESDSL